MPSLLTLIPLLILQALAMDQPTKYRPVQDILQPVKVTSKFFFAYLENVKENAGIDFDASVAHITEKLEEYAEKVITYRSSLNLQRSKHPVKSLRALESYTEFLLDMWTSSRTSRLFLEMIQSSSDEKERIRNLIVAGHEVYGSVCSIIEVFMMRITNDFEKEYVQRMKAANLKLLNARNVQALEDMERLLPVLLEVILPNLYSFSPQLYSAIRACLLYSHGMFRIAASEFKRTGLPDATGQVLVAYLLTQLHYCEFSKYLYLCHRSNPYLTLPVMLRILEDTPLSVYNDMLDSIVPACSYFRQFLLQAKYIEHVRPSIVNFINGAQKEMEEMSEKALDELISLEAERALKIKESNTSKKGKKPTTRGLAKPTKHLSARTPSEPIFPLTFEMPARPVDQRERDYATLVVGEYLLQIFLRPTLHIIGFGTNNWSWDLAMAAIESELSSRLSSRKHFLIKCIEWIRKRNAVAHPQFQATSQLLKDLNQVKSLVDAKSAAELVALMQKFKPLTAVKFEAPLDDYGWKGLGFSTASIQQCICTFRVTEFFLSRTVAPFFEAEGLPANLATLRTLRDFASLQEHGLTKEQVSAFCVLLEKRNSLAHPSITAQMVRVLVALFLKDDPDYESFLADLGR